MYGRINYSTPPHYQYPNYQQPAIHHNMTQPSPYYKPAMQTPFDVLSKPKLPIDQEPFKQQTASFGKPKSNLLHHFQTKEGELDLDKMLTTAGKFADTVQQVSPVVKQFSSMMQQFK